MTELQEIAELISEEYYRKKDPMLKKKYEALAKFYNNLAKARIFNQTLY